MNLSINLINAILQYLSQRPYAEVAGFIQAIEQEAQAQGLVPVQEQDAEEKVEDDS